MNAEDPNDVVWLVEYEILPLRAIYNVEIRYDKDEATLREAISQQFPRWTIRKLEVRK